MRSFLGRAFCYENGMGLFTPILYAYLIVQPMVCQSAYGGESPTRPGAKSTSQEILLEQPVDFAGVGYKLSVIAIHTQGIRAVFSNSKNKTQEFELANPYPPSATLIPLKLGKNTPPTIHLELTGCSDGSTCIFTYLFSLVDGKVVQTFSANYEDNSYFRRAQCGHFGLDQDGGSILDEEDFDTIRRSKLVWDSRLKRIKRLSTKRVQVFAVATETVKLHSKSSHNSPVIKTISKGGKFEILSAVFCNEKNDGELCSAEPGERYRWFKVRYNQTTYWLWEQELFETDLKCNERMEM